MRSRWITAAGGLAVLGLLRPVSEPATAAGLPTVEIIAPAVDLYADGRSSIDLDLEVRRADGTPAPDGYRVPLRSSLGEVVSVTPTSGGMATARLRSGTWPANARLTAPGFVVVGDDIVPFQRGEPTSMQLHLHGSVSEGDATMIDHTVDNEAFGVDVMWWTDHDGAYMHPDYTLYMFDFEGGDLIVPFQLMDIGLSYNGFELLDDTFAEGAGWGGVDADAAYDGDYGLRIEGSGSEPLLPRHAVWSLSAGSAWPNTLFAGLTVEFQIRPWRVAGDDPGELFIKIPLSRRGTGPDRAEGEYDSIIVYHSERDYTGDSDEMNLYLPMELDYDTWNTVSLDLTAIAASFATRGIDQHIDGLDFEIRAARDETARYDIDNIVFQPSVEWEELRDAQREFVASLPYAPTQLVGSEISGFGDSMHFNAYGDNVPLLPYEYGEWDRVGAVEWVHQHGGIVSFNHVFGTSGGTRPDEDVEIEVQEAIEAWRDHHGYGADLMEVGYRARGGDMLDFFQVWDTMASEGVVLTGIGCSDQHDTVSYTESANNFVTWVPAANRDDEELIYHLRRGQAWFGDPTMFPMTGVNAQLQALEAKAVMGQVVEGATGPQTIRFRADPLQPGWIVRMVENGEPRVADVVVATEGTFTMIESIDPAGGNVVRFEVYDGVDDLPILATNPIIFSDDPWMGEPSRIPEP